MSSKSVADRRGVLLPAAGLATDSAGNANSVPRPDGTLAPATGIFVPASGDTTGVTDTAALNAALALAGQYATAKTRTVRLARADYYVNGPVRVPARVQLIGDGGGSTEYGTVIWAVTTAAWPQYRGVLETSNYGDYGGAADYWHAGAMVDLEVRPVNINSANRPEYMVVAFGMGEHSTLRRVSAWNAKKSGILLAGYAAPGTLEHCSAWSCAEYGLLFSTHADPAYPATGVENRTQNGGSYRIELSGDGNVFGHIHATGVQIVDLTGLKSELNNPVIRISGSGFGSARQRWSITGYRSEHGVVAATRNFIEIAGTARPQIFIGAGACYNAINLISDAVTGKTVAANAAGKMLLYDTSYDVEVVSASTQVGTDLTVRGVGASNSTVTQIHDQQAGYQTRGLLAYSGEFYQFQTGTANNPVWSVDDPSGARFNLYTRNAANTAMEKCVLLDGGGIRIATATQKIGFFGATTVVKPTVTGSRGGNAALASLLTQLAALGLVTDSSSA